MNTIFLFDEYPRRCVNQIARWKEQSKDLVSNKELSHTRTHEYGSFIMEAMETDIPIKIGASVMNDGLITNLPYNCAVEVSCLVDRTGNSAYYCRRSSGTAGGP